MSFINDAIKYGFDKPDNEVLDVDDMNEARNDMGDFEDERDSMAIASGYALDEEQRLIEEYPEENLGDV